ncbi:DNA polymerase delta subunit 3 [Pieris brassicae]|uniref:DNA polymerase delta subunit 3 n=1 Tax=Pieris brassicae TaxID=7116 RepID=UPI001E661ABB|nr:DNA polymerase delta subunit 3 [Pieris brassicae]
MEMDDTHINLLKDMILDEGKLVTYLTLAKDLCLHINNSKLLMHSFIKSIREENPKLELNINFLISGLIDENKVKVAVCSEDKLEEYKKTFKVVYFIHVYSICKGMPKENSAALVTLTKYDDFNLCPGIIKSHASIKRSDVEIGILKSSSQKKIVNQVVSHPKKAKQEDKLKPLKNVQEINGKTFKSEPDLEIKNEIMSPKKNFKPNIKPSTHKGIAGFFNKQNGINNKKENKITVDLKETSKKVVDVSKTEQDALNDIMDIDNQQETEVKNEARNENIMNDNKILSNIKKHSKVDKKRKRVLHVSDSDSEEENDPFVAEEKKEIAPESDEEIPPTPVANNLKITTGIVNPRKKRKVVDKTYMSDDGYIITKREEVYESCSDSESVDKEVSVKKEIKEEKLQISPKTKPKEVKNSPKKKKVSPPQKGKQATLMNFFKKK